MPKEKDEEFKFGIEDMADALDIEPQSVRIKLRNAGIPKRAAGGTRYGWKNKTDLDADAKKLKETKSTKKEAPAKADKKAKGDKKSDAKGKKKAPEKKAA